MTQREVALETLYERVGQCLKHDEFHIPIQIAAAWWDVKHAVPDECAVCHDSGDTVMMKPT